MKGLKREFYLLPPTSCFLAFVSCKSGTFLKEFDVKKHFRLVIYGLLHVFLKRALIQIFLQVADQANKLINKKGQKMCKNVVFNLMDKMDTICLFP